MRVGVGVCGGLGAVRRTLVCQSSSNQPGYPLTWPGPSHLASLLFFYTLMQRANVRPGRPCSRLVRCRSAGTSWLLRSRARSCSHGRCLRNPVRIP